MCTWSHNWVRRVRQDSSNDSILSWWCYIHRAAVCSCPSIRRERQEVWLLSLDMVSTLFCFVKPMYDANDAFSVKQVKSSARNAQVSTTAVDNARWVAIDCVGRKEKGFPVSWNIGTSHTQQGSNVSIHQAECIPLQKQPLLPLTRLMIRILHRISTEPEYVEYIAGRKRSWSDLMDREYIFFSLSLSVPLKCPE